MKIKTLGILGGVGPLASVYFADLVVNLTDADTDQEHIPLILYNDNSIPDRTAYILGRSDIDPVPRIVEDIKKLADFGSDFIVITFNTAHTFYDAFQSASDVPVINMIDEAVNATLKARPNAKKIGVLATDGTLQSGVYKKAIEERGLAYLVPSEPSQRDVMSLIYDQVKAGKEADLRQLLRVIDEMRHMGCDVIILGCTELSVINKQHNLSLHSGDIVDAMEALAKTCITLCGRQIKE